MKAADLEQFRDLPNDALILFRFNGNLDQPDYTAERYLKDNPQHQFLVSIDNYLDLNSQTVMVENLGILRRYQETYNYYKKAIYDLRFIMAIVHIHRITYANMLYDHIKRNLLSAFIDKYPNKTYQLPLVLPTIWEDVTYMPDFGIRHIDIIIYREYERGEEPAPPTPLVENPPPVDRGFARASPPSPETQRMISGFTMLNYFSALFKYRIDDAMLNYLKNHDYIYRYYVWVNRKNYFVQANIGDLPISPQIFEIFNAGGDVDIQYRRGNGSVFRSEGIQRHGDRRAEMPNVLGWTKLSMAKAIDKSGLRRNFPKPLRWYGRTNGIARRDVGDTRNEGYPGFENTEGLMLPGLINLSNVPEFNIPEGTIDEMGNTSEEARRLRRLATRKLYGVRSYYEEIYRRIYSTLTYQNWEEICRFDPELILEHKETIKLEYGLVDRDFEDPNKACAKIREINGRRKELVDQLVELVPFRSQAIKHDPNSIWVTSNVDPDIFRSADRTEVPKTPYEKFVLINLWCQDEKINKEELLRNLTEARMIYLFPADPARYEKEDICEYVIESVKKDAEKYEHLAFDCSDPSIRKRHILNAMDIMGLGDVFKNIDYLNITKEELCDKVNKYISILQETKAFNYASRVNPSYNQ